MTALVAGGTSVLSALGLLFLKGQIANTLYPLLWISISIFAVNSFYTIFMEVLRIQQKSGLYTRLNLTNYYGSLVLGLVFVLAFSLRIEGLMYGALLI